MGRGFGGDRVMTRSVVSSLAVSLLLGSAAPAFADDGGGAPGIRSEQEAAVQRISPRRLKEAVDFLASDELGGRIPGSDGHRRARDYIRDRLVEIGLEPRGRDGFFQTFPEAAIRGRFQRTRDGQVVPNADHESCNVIGLLRGSDPVLSKQYVLYMAHYDHLGLNERGDVFNGAFDNAGGVAVGLEVARVLSREGARPRRSILFVFSDSEESGLSGARTWIEDPTLPREDLVMMISGDPLGRRTLPDYGAIIVSGLERSPDLLDFFRRTTGFADGTDVAFVHRDIIPIFHSDQDRFHAAGIPGMWFVNPGFSFYHQRGDDPATIDYRILEADARYIARSMLLVGDSDRRFAYQGPPPMTATTGRDARVVLGGLLRSPHLTDAERAKGERLLAGIDKMIEADDPDVLPGGKAFFFEAVGFLFELSRAHPGEIPPPWPARLF